jgi:hypothetical protein
MYSLHWTLGETKGRAGRYGVQKNLLPLPGTETRPLGRLH